MRCPRHIRREVLLLAHGRGCALVGGMREYSVAISQTVEAVSHLNMMARIFGATLIQLSLSPTVVCCPCPCSSGHVSMGAALRCRVDRAVGRHISQGLQGRPEMCQCGPVPPSAQSPPSVHRDEQAPPVTHPIQAPAPSCCFAPAVPSSASPSTSAVIHQAPLFLAPLHPRPRLLPRPSQTTTPTPTCETSQRPQPPPSPPSPIRVGASRRPVRSRYPPFILLVSGTC